MSRLRGAAGLRGAALIAALVGPLAACAGAAAPGRVAYLPVAYQAGAAGEASFDPSAGDGSPVRALLDALNAHLAARARDGLVGPVRRPGGTPPDVQFGCDHDGLGDCVIDDEGGLHGPGRMRMRLAVARPSSDWTAAAVAATAAAGADAVLVVTLEVGQYWPRQTNWRGSKAVDLGTDRTVALPWLTSLETPISVIQLTGALVGPDGKAIRIGAEGLRARRTPIVAAGFGWEAVIRDEDVAGLLDERVEDRPDAPLVWQAALDALLAELTGVSGGSEASETGPA